MNRLSLTLLALFCLPLQAAAPAPANWSADPAKSTLEFSFVQAGAQTTGRFAKFTTAVDFSPADLAHARFDVAIDVASVDTRDQERDAQLRSAELFDSAKFAKAQFVATQFTAKASAFEGLGKLTLRGVTRDVPLSFTFQPATEAGQTVAWLKGSATIKRLDFGVGQGEWQSTDWVGNEVKIAFNLRLVPRAAGPAPGTPPAPAAKGAAQ
jgi:polyisoprenoid-binding protein YceI